LTPPLSHQKTTSLYSRIDLRKVLDRSPYVVHELMPLYRAYRLFQSMGLRSLFVVDSRHCVVGVITRADIAKATALGDVKEEKNVKAQMRMLEANYRKDRLGADHGHRKLSVLQFDGWKERSSAAAAALDDPTHLRRRHSEPSLAVFELGGEQVKATCRCSSGNRCSSSQEMDFARGSHAAGDTPLHARRESLRLSASYVHAAVRKSCRQAHLPHLPHPHMPHLPHPHMPHLPPHLAQLPHLPGQLFHRPHPNTDDHADARGWWCSDPLAPGAFDSYCYAT